MTAGIVSTTTSESCRQRVDGEDLRSVRSMSDAHLRRRECAVRGGVDGGERALDLFLGRGTVH